MKRWSAVAGVLLLAASTPVRSAPPGAERCNASVDMGDRVSISTTDVYFKNCVDRSNRDCAFLWFFCEGPEPFRTSVAVAECELTSDHGYELAFKVELASEAISIAPPFSGDLTCGFEGKRALETRSAIDALAEEAARQGYPCDGDPRPMATRNTQVQCRVTP